MKFTKDILLIDFEGVANPVQVGAVLLDKESLVVKDAFTSYIYTDLKGEVKKASGISQKDLEGAPSQAEVGSIIFKRFGTNIFLASWVADADITNFKKIINAAGIDFSQYDYHILDIWPIAYLYLLQQGYAGGVRSEEIFREFGIPPRGLHNALEDCHIAADVLRKLIG